MSRLQKLIMSVVPRTWAAAMEAESRAWMMRCECGFERSVWEAGGLRWKAAGKPRQLAHCPQCGKYTMHKFYRPDLGQTPD